MDRSQEGLVKVTLYLFEDDKQWYEKRYGFGWSVRLREHVHARVASYRATDKGVSDAQ